MATITPPRMDDVRDAVTRVQAEIDRLKSQDQTGLARRLETAIQPLTGHGPVDTDPGRDDLLETSDLRLVTDATRSMIDHWRVRGYIRPVDPEPIARTHTGGPTYLWDPVEAEILRIMVVLSRAGMSPGPASALARDTVTGHVDSHDLGDGITLHITTRGARQ